MPQGNKARTPQLLSLHSGARKLQGLKPEHLGAQAQQQGKPLQ